jgi:hypothetical protein
VSTSASIRAGPDLLEVPKSLLTIAAPRIAVQHFHDDGTPALTLRRAEQEPHGGVELEGSPGARGVIRIDGNVLTAHVPDDPYTAESALRVAFQLAVVRRGGVLVHSSSIAFGDRAIVAIGQSGDGKSTLARLCIEAGGTLLSDEMTAIFPDGTVYGTPFRSTETTPGSPGPAQLGLLVVLEKAPFEGLERADVRSVLPRMLAQVYRGFDAGVLTPAEILSRLSEVIGKRAPQILRFRKDPNAGRFVAEALRAL